jgi:hypothetical protein
MRRTWTQIKNETMTKKEQRQAHTLAVPDHAVPGPDEMEDYLELQDPKVREHIRESHEEFLAGKHRAAQDLLRELKRQRKRRLPGVAKSNDFPHLLCAGDASQVGEVRARVSRGVGMDKDKERRKRLASLSFSEKLKILEKLRDRDRAIAASGLRKMKVCQGVDKSS